MMEMEPPRMSQRQLSHQMPTRHGFESKNKSPLSVSMSADYSFEPSRTSREFQPYPNANPFAMPRAAFSPNGIPNGMMPDRRAFADPFGPASTLNNRYGAGGQGRQQIQLPLLKPQRLGKVPTTTNRWTRYTPRTPGEGFKKLPEEILLLILEHLRSSHLEFGSLSCATCCMRDLINIGLSSKKWWNAAKIALYTDIQLSGLDSTIHTKKKFKMKHGTRLKLLRKTLRARQDLAEQVKSLKVPSVPETAKSKEEVQEYMDLVASVIMACPNLERLPGFYPAYDHSFSRFTHALSTRTKLKEAVWIINPSPFQRQRRYNFSGGSQEPTSILAPANLMPEQYVDFLGYHSNWSNLKTLFLHCNQGGTVDSLLFRDIFKRLPVLENLHVSAFPAPAFDDTTLTYLPPLKSLRLDNLSGITATGLSIFASLPSSSSLTRLSLISIPLISLPTLARVLSHLRSLTHLTISQAPSLCLPPGEEVFLHPYLASNTLQYLHWEITNPSDDEKATQILVKSISYSGFPALRTMRAPTDFDGSLQTLCKPRDKIELSGDRYRNPGPPGYHGMPTSQSLPNMSSSSRSRSSQGGHSYSSSVSSSFVKSPTRSSFSMNNDRRSFYSDNLDTRERGMSLLTARRMAQQRLEAAVSKPKFQIAVWDENDGMLDRQTVGGYIGLIQSKVYYSLRPDVDGMDEAVVTVDGIGGLLDSGEETNVRDGCTGSWNLSTGTQGKSGKTSGKERWWHTDRGRFREVPLEKFF